MNLRDIYSKGKRKKKIRLRGLMALWATGRWENLREWWGTGLTKGRQDIDVTVRQTSQPICRAFSTNNFCDEQYLTNILSHESSYYCIWFDLNVKYTNYYPCAVQFKHLSIHTVSSKANYCVL